MIEFSVYGWAIPTIITVASFVWALFSNHDDGSYMSGMYNVFLLIPAALISMVSWIVYAILK